MYVCMYVCTYVCTYVRMWHIIKYAKDSVSRKLYAYRLSQDQAGHTGKGRKFTPAIVLESYEGKLATKEIVGNAQTGTGLGLRPRKKQSLQEKRKQLALMKEDAENEN